MISFTRAPTVAKGDPITSTQLRLLAAAFNDRLRSGLGDGPWRLHFYWLSLFRQVRNPDEGGTLFPALAEFFTAGYQVLEPGDAEWPVAGPGDPEGSNLACQMMAYVFGAAATSLDSEDVRLTNPDAGGIPLSPTGTDAEYWDLAKQQRGGYDPATGGMASPAWSAPREHYRLAFSGRSPHGNAYGSYLPTPDLEPDVCDEVSSDEPLPINYHVHFTGLHGVASIDYPGTCVPTGSNAYPDHVKWIGYAPWAYYVLKNDGSLDVLKTSDYVEGPYSGEAALRKTQNAGIPRMINSFMGEFRGSDTQRRGPSYWLQESFDFQAFLTAQYHLAPNIGTEVDGVITPTYPLFRFTGATMIPLGTLGIHTQSGTDHHDYNAAAVLTGCMITAVKLQGSVTIELLSGDTLLQSATVTADVDGNVSKLVILSKAVVPAPLKVRLGTHADFTDGTGKIEAECTELLKGFPTHEDMFLVLRCGGAIGDGFPDGRGIDEDSARIIGENYFSLGCITSAHGAIELPAPGAPVNGNSVFDAARRLSQCIRMVPRQNFVGYAVQDGKSVCWFTRGAQIGPNTYDLLKGIAPLRDVVLSGSLMTGRKYVVRSGTINYQGTDYTAGQTFTALDGAATYAGTGPVYEYDGMRHTAEVKGFTNEWLMGVQLKAYHPSDSSLWKPDAYSDYFPLINRCHFYSPEIANDPPLVWHTAYGNRVAGLFGGVLSPESPTALNYAPLYQPWNHHNNVNQIDCDDADEVCKEARRNFYRSCRLYEPDPEIESAVVEMDGDTELIKLTFTGRFHHAAAAPSTIARDIGTWDVTALRAEATTIRTVENALREYLVNQNDGTNATASGPGNAGANSTVQSNPDNPYGSVYPTFLFTQLIPSPYEDGNDVQDSTDSPFLHDQFTQMELYLRAMCEGYVDGATTADYTCTFDTASLFDFTFENLCLAAFGDRWFHTLPLTIRPDDAQGFGPLPNTQALATIFNEFAAAVNLLTRVRVMLPMKLQLAFDDDQAVEWQQIHAADDSFVGCAAGAIGAWYWSGPLIDVSPVETGAWVDSGGLGPSAYVYGIIDGECDSSLNWGIKTIRRNARCRWQPTDPDAIEAIPEAWRAMLQDHSAVLAKVHTTRRVTDLQLVDTLELSQSCCFDFDAPCPGAWVHGMGHWWSFPDTVTDDPVTCAIMPSKIIAPPLPVSINLGRCVTASGAVCTPGPRNDVAVEVVTDTNAMIEVPLV